MVMGNPADLIMAVVCFGLVLGLWLTGCIHCNWWNCW